MTRTEPSSAGLDSGPSSVETPPARVRLLRCRECDLLQRMRPVPAGARAHCGRCGALVFARRPRAIARSVALYVTALLLWVVANSFSFMTLEIQGRRQTSALITGTLGLYEDGHWTLATLVFLFVIAFPLLKIVATLSVLVPIARRRRSRHAATLLRVAGVLHRWSMTEVFLAGVLVSYAKMIELASVEIGVSLVAFVALIVTVLAADTSIEPLQLWERVRRSPLVPPPTPSERARLVGCGLCGLVSRLPLLAKDEAARCPRCRSLVRRRSHGLAACFALLVAALILYVPANLYPVLTIFVLGNGVPSTILGGVQELIAFGMIPLALLVFLVSIVVPVLKMSSLLYLLSSVRRRSRARLHERAVLYRMVESVGRWAMVDIFVLSILVALIRLGSLASVEPGVGAISFAAAIVLALCAALTFDPRLIWDAAGANRER